MISYKTIKIKTTLYPLYLDNNRTQYDIIVVFYVVPLYNKKYVQQNFVKENSCDLIGVIQKFFKPVIL